MIFIFVVFFLSESVIRETAAASGLGGPQGGRAGKKADLLEVIKLNLRKNNDHYTDVPITYTATQRTLLPNKIIASFNNIQEKFINKKKMGIRRANDGLLIESDAMLDFDKHSVINNSKVDPQPALRSNIQMIQPISSNVGKTKPTEPTTASSLPSLTTNMRTFPKKLKKMKKIQKFYEKNQALLKEFMSSKLAAKTQTVAQTKPPVKQDLRQRQKAPKGFGVLSRGQDWLGSEDAGPEPPNPDLLDMLPAVGGRIHFRRIQGRLCHRHVVIPEGPKYDSKGRVYLAAHADKLRRPYPVTRRPRLLLPKCCNCCRKSVLGCE